MGHFSQKCESVKNMQIFYFLNLNPMIKKQLKRLFLNMAKTDRDFLGICHSLLCANAPQNSKTERGGPNFVDPEK